MSAMEKVCNVVSIAVDAFGREKLTHAMQSMVSSALHFRRMQALDIILAITKVEANTWGMMLPARISPVLEFVATFILVCQCIEASMGCREVIHTVGPGQRDM